MSTISHQFLSALMATIPDRVYFKDRDGRFLAVNRAFLDFLGVADEAAVLGKTDFDIFLPEHAQQAAQDERAVLETERPIVGKIEKEVLPSGKVFWVSTTKMPLRDEEGRVLGICGISRDVTRERLQAEETTAVTQALAERQARIESELALASRVQMSLLPNQHRRFPPAPGEDGEALRFRHRYVPMHHVGGDFFSLFPVSPTEAGILICDVMGHGVCAAFIAVVQRVLIEDLAAVAGNPAAFLAALNERLHRIFASLDAPLFVTACYAVIDAATGRLRYASAAHPRPHLIRRAGAVHAAGIASDARVSPPLGMLPDFECGVEEDRLEPGDRLLLFTDGLRDAPSLRHDGPGESWLSETLGRIAGAGTPKESLLDALLSSALRAAGPEGLQDDVCVVEAELLRTLG